MTRKRRTRLRLGEIDMISLVDRGDNPEAHVMIHKKKGFPFRKEGGKIDAMHNPDDDRVGLAERILKYLGVGKDDLDLDKEVIVDKDATELRKELDELQEKFDALEKKTATAEAVSSANEGIAKAQSIEDVDKVIAGLEDVDIIKAVTDSASDRKAELAKSADDAVVKAFRDKLPVPLQKAFDDMDEDDQKSFMKSYSGSDDDPMAKTVEKLAGENDDLRGRLDKVEQRESEGEIEKELAALDGIVPSVPEIAKRIARLRKTSPDEADAALVEYKALAKQAEEKGDLFKILGNDDDTPGDAEAALDKAVEKHMAAHPDVTKEAAETAVLEADPALYDAYNEEKEQG